MKILLPDGKPHRVEFLSVDIGSEWAPVKMPDPITISATQPGQASVIYLAR